MPLPAYAGISPRMVNSQERKTTGSGGCTCLRLRKVSRGVSQIYDRHLEPFGLTVTQYGVLGHLATFGSISIGELAEKLVMDPTTLTRNIRPLLRQGLVAVRPHRRDRRLRLLNLTAGGRKAFTRAKPGWLRAQRHIEQVFGEMETPALHAALDRILERLATRQKAPHLQTQAIG